MKNTMKRWLLPVLTSLSLFASPGLAKGKAPAKVDPKTVPGTVKWLCHNFEKALVDAKQAKCGAKDKSVDNNYHQCLEVVNSGVGQKRLAHSGPAAQKCLAAQGTYVKKPSYDTRQAMVEACAAAVVGKKAKDEACESPVDCAAGLTCLGIKGSSPGKCAKPLDEGEPCDTDLLGGSAFIGLLQEAHPICSNDLICSQEPGHPRVCTVPPKGKASGYQQASGAACKDDAQCKGLCQAGTCKAVCGSG